MSAGVGSQVVLSDTSIYSNPETFFDLLPIALKDINIDYSRSLAKTTQLLIVYGFDAINNMLINVLKTVIGERDFEPTFGSKALYILHEPNDSIVSDKVETELYDRVRRWVPYIDLSLSGIICQPIPSAQAYRIVFVYREKITGIKNTFSTYISKTDRFITSNGGQR